MHTGALGEFEQIVLLAIVQLGDSVYGASIVQEIRHRTGRHVAPAAVHITVRRLESRGLVTTWLGDPTPERGGKARRYVKVTRAGLETLRAGRKVIDQMWQGLDPGLRGTR